MANLFDYIKWRGDLEFSKSPLNPVDFLIFSQLSYLPFDGIIPAPGEKNGVSLSLALELLLDKLNDGCLQLHFKEDPDFIISLINSERYKNCHLLGYVNNIDDKKEIQFSALCIYTGEGSCVIVYRGTDTTITGWKENFNMAFMEVIPAQKEAVKYIENMAGYLNEKLHITGHSKGGNLAVYAASFCSDKIKNRITDIYSFDAPGFHESVITSAGYNEIKNKIKSYIPQSSIVGMMLERDCDFFVIKSSQTGFVQHILYTWEVIYNDIEKAEQIDLSSRFVEKTVREWINGFDTAEREEFVEGIYKILKTSEVKSVHEMEKSWPLTLGRIIKSITHIDEDTRRKTLKTMAELFRTAGKNLDTFFNKEKEKN